MAHYGPFGNCEGKENWKNAGKKACDWFDYHEQIMRVITDGMTDEQIVLFLADEKTIECFEENGEEIVEGKIGILSKNMDWDKDFKDEFIALFK